MLESPEAQVDAVDTTWADKYMASIRPVALRHGQKVFEFTMAVGVAGEAVKVLHRRIAGNMELMRALTILTSVCDKFANELLATGDFKEQYEACKRDIEQTQPSIMVPANDHKIIIPS